VALFFARTTQSTGYDQNSTYALQSSVQNCTLPASTLRDAALYITKLPKAEHEVPEWQAAMQALILVATKGGPTMLARIGIMRALHHHEIREFDTDRKPHHWGKRKLARDR
jgi:hypothetical protein